MKHCALCGETIEGTAAVCHQECADDRLWRPVSEQPKEGEDIIVARITEGYKRWWKGAYINGEFVTVDRDGLMQSFDATHWMTVLFPSSAFDSLNPPDTVQTC